LEKKYQVRISGVERIEEDSSGRIWVCGGNGIGFFSESGNFVEEHYEDFDASLAWLHEDYQGNMWVASSRYGVMELVKSKFQDVFKKAGIESQVVNAVTFYNGDYYCGTDEGLLVLSGQDLTLVDTPAAALLEGERVRSLMVDSENRLWICSYCDNGLICLGQGDAMTVYNVENSGLASNRVRCSAELSVGTIAVGTAEGISFLSDGQVVGSLTARDGLLNPQILSLAEGEDGILYAGTDGSGLYGIRNQAIVTHYGKREGLSSDVVLRVVPYEGGIFLVDSNALCYLKDGEIRILEGFPYFNNFDIQFYDDTAYVLSSAGIYEVSAKELCRGGDMDYTLYTEGDGLAASLTANSWNYMDEYGMLYLCTNSGVTRFDKWRQSQSVEYRYGLTSVSCDGVEAERDGDTWTLPASARRVEVTASVRNYKLSSEKVRIFVRGMEEQGILTDFDELDSLVLTGLTAGTYKVCLQIMDAKGETVEQEKVFTLIKKRQIWENGWYKAYLYGVLLEVLFYAAWSLGIILQSRRQKSEMEKMQAVLEEKVDIQTKVIRLQQEETKHLFSQTVMALSDAVDAKDRYTSGHSKRVAHYAALIAEKMGKSEEEKEKIHRAALLHDIGKIRIPEHIINKTSRLTDDEFELIKVHPIVGYHVLNRIPGETTLAQGAKFHHEWYDGSGYPEGLKGKDIPEVARIIGVADSYDAMASNRSYRSALPQDVVRREIEKGKGVQFDPEIADIMLQLIDADKDYTMKQTEELKQYILVVDDEPENIRMVEQMLADEPMYEITSAESGPEALELLQKKEFHLVLLDVDMPEMDGFETLAHIREFSSVPVVLMSVERDGTLLEKIVEYDAADCLTKPLLPLSLKEVFHSMLNGLEMG
jgi:energy-coupling factor transport system substrate-specific component